MNANTNTNRTPIVSVSTREGSFRITCTNELSAPGAVYAARSYFDERGFNLASMKAFVVLSHEAGISVARDSKNNTLVLGCYRKPSN